MKLKTGDTVRVVIPEFFVRCGYNRTYESCLEELSNDPEVHQKIHKFACDVLGFKHNNHFGENEFGVPYYLEKYVEKFLKVLAYQKLGIEGFGGKTRKIFTETFENQKDALFVVTEKFTCVTGEYFPPGGDYEEYEPGGLMNQKTNVILKVRQREGFNTFFIEEKNVSFVPETDFENYPSWKDGPYPTDRR